ncbi:unnamed protein product [Closterium sp. Yama58-4]|nr:unnamed protein product [Closterium sp. Yama58-4]
MLYGLKHRRGEVPPEKRRSPRCKTHSAVADKSARLWLSSQAEAGGGLTEMRHLQFLVWKNLGDVYAKLGSDYSESALRAYVTATEIDGQDVVLWHRLGSMALRTAGRARLARYALEQGLTCSPYHWGCLNKLLEVLVTLDDWQAAQELSAYVLHLTPTHARARQVLAMANDVFHPDPVALQAALDGLAARASATGVPAAGDSAAAPPAAAAAAAAAGDENGLDVGRSAGATAGLEAQEQGVGQQGSALGSEVSVQHSPEFELRGRSWAELILNTVHVFRTVQQRSVEKRGLEYPQPVAGVSVKVVLADSLQGGDSKHAPEGLVRAGGESGCGRNLDDEGLSKEQKLQSCAAGGSILSGRDSSVDMACGPKSCPVEAASEPTALPQPSPATHPSESPLPEAPLDPPTALPQPDPSSRVSALSEHNFIAVVDLSMDEDSQPPPDTTPTPTAAELPDTPGPPDVDEARPTLTPLADLPLTQTPVTQTPGTQTPGTQTPGTQTPGTQTPGTQTPGTQTAATSVDVTPVSTQEDSPVVTPAALTEAPNASAAAVPSPAAASHGTATADAVAPDSAAPALPAKSRKRHRHPLSFVGTERRTRQQIKEMQLQEAKGKESSLLESAKPLPPKRLRVFDILSACFKQQSRLMGSCDGNGLEVAVKKGEGKEIFAVGVAEGGVGADAAAAIGAGSTCVGSSGGGACDGLEMLHMLRRKQVLVRFFSKDEEWSSVDVAAGAEAGAGGAASEGVKAVDSRDPAGDAKQVQSFLAALPKRLPLLQAASLILQYLASHLALWAFTPSVLDALLWLERQAASWEGRSPSVWLYLGEVYLVRGVQSDVEIRGRREAVGGAVERECVHCLAMAEQAQMDEEGVRWEVDGGAWGPVGGGRIAPEQADGEAEELGQGKGHDGLGGWEKVAFWVRLRASQGQVAMRRGKHGKAIELFTWCRDALGRAEQIKGRSDGVEGMLLATAGPEAVAALAHAAVEVPHLACVWGPSGGISVQGLDELLSELHVDCVLAGLSGKGEGEAGQELPQPPQQQQQLINMMKPLLLRDGAAGMGGGAGRQKGRSYCLPGLASHSSISDGCQGVNADSQHSEQSSGKWLETLKRVVAATRGMAQEQLLTLVCYKHILALLSSRISMGALPPAPAKATPAVSAATEGSAAAAGKASAAGGGGGRSDAGASCEAELMQTVQGLRDLTVSMALGTGLDSLVNEQHLEELQQVVAVLIDFAFYKHRLLQEQPASQLSREVYQPGLGAAAARSGILAAWQGMVVAWQGLLVDLCMALCCLQHLRVSVNLTDTVAMWAITHSILASQGLCCATASPSSSSSSAADIPPSPTPNTASAPVNAASSCRQSGKSITAAAEVDRGEGTPAAARAPSGKGAFLALSAQLLTNLESLLTPSVHAGGKKTKLAAAGGKEPGVRGLKGGRGGEARKGVGGLGARGEARDMQRTGGNGAGCAGDKAEKTAVGVGDTPDAGRASMGKNGGTVGGSGQGARLEDAHGKRCALQEIEGAMGQCFLCLYGVQLRGAEEDVGGESSGGAAGQEAAAAGLVQHQNTLAGELKSKDQCAQALRHMAPFVTSFTFERLVKLVPLLTSIHSFFPSPPPAILARHSVEPFLDDPQVNDWGMVGRIVSKGKRLDEGGGELVGGHIMAEDGGAEEGRRITEDRDGLFVKGKEAMNDGGEPLNRDSTLDTSPDILSYIPVLHPHSFLSEWTSSRHPAAHHADLSHAMNSDTYADVYNPLFAMLARIEPIPMGHHMPPGFFLEPKGHSHVLQVTSPLLADLCYHPSNTDSWLKLALFYDEASDLMLNDGAKMKGPADWHAEEGVLGRLQGYRQRCTRCLVEALATPGCRLPFEVAALEESDSRWEGWTGREGRKVWEGRKGSEGWEGCEEQRKRVVSVLELLAFVVYDSIQNVVPSYDRLRHTQVKDDPWLNRCRLAFQLFRILQSLSPNWQYPFFRGKLAEKLHLPASLALPLMCRAVSLRPNAVDTAYRLHASRLKALARGRRESALSDDDIRVLVSNSEAKDALAKLLQPNEEEAQSGGGVTAAEGSIARDTGHVTDGGEKKVENGEDEGVEGRGEAQGEKGVERGVAEGLGSDKGAASKNDGSDEELEMGKGVAERLGVDNGAEGEKDGSDEVLEVESSKEGKEGATQEEEIDEGKEGATQEEEIDEGKEGATQEEEIDEGKEGATQEEEIDEGKEGATQEEEIDEGKEGATQEEEIDEGKEGETEDKEGGAKKGGLGETQVENEEEGGGGDGGGVSVGEGEDDDDDVVLVEPTQIEPTQVEPTQVEAAQDSCSVKKRKGGDLPSATGKKHSRLAREGESLGQAEQAPGGGEASRTAAESAVQSEERGAGIADLEKEKQQAEEGESGRLGQQGKKQQAPPIDIQQLRQHWPLVWQHLFQESEKGVRECLEGDFKHFHRGRYCLAKAYLRRGAPGDLERAKSELGFCFRKAKVAFAMNMWEICVHTKHAPRPKGGSKGARVRRKVVGLASVEVAESSRKFMTCVRVYLLMYLRLCCYTGDVAALEGALSTLKTDKEFSTALVDLVPLALALFRMHLHTMLCWSHALLGALSDILPVSAWPLFPWLHPLSLSDLPSATPPLLCKGTAVTEKEEDNNGGAEDHTGLVEGDCLEETEEDSVGGSDSEDSILNLISDDEEEEEEEDEVDEEGNDEAKEVQEGGRRDAGTCMDEAGMGGKVSEGAGGKERVDHLSTPAAVGVEAGAAGPVPVMTRGGLRVTIPLLQGRTLMQPAPYPSSASDATAPLHNPTQSQSPLALPSGASTKAFGAIAATGTPAAGSAAASLPSTPSNAPSFPGKPICTNSSPSPFATGRPSSPFPSLTPPRVNLLLVKAKASESDADRALALLRSAQALEREASGELPFGKVLGGGKKGGVSGGGGALGMKRMKAAAREGAGSSVRADVLGRSVGGGGVAESGHGMQVTGTSFVDNSKAGEAVEQVGRGESAREGRSNEEEEVEEWRTRLHGLSTQLLEVAYALVHGRSLAALAAAEQAQAQMKVQAEEQARAEELAVGGKRAQGEAALNGLEDEGQQALLPGTETEAKVTTATPPKLTAAAASTAAVSAAVVTTACSSARRMERHPSPCKLPSTNAQALPATAASPSAAVSRDAPPPAVPAQASAAAAAAASPSRSPVPDAAEERLPAPSHPPKLPSCSPTGAAPILKPPLARLPKLARRFQAGLKRKQAEGEDIGRSMSSEGRSARWNGDGVVNEADKRRLGANEAAAAAEASTGTAAEAAPYEGVMNGWTGCSRTDGVRVAPSAAINGSSVKGEWKEDRDDRRRGRSEKGRKVVDGRGVGCERVDVEGGEWQVRGVEERRLEERKESDNVVLQQNVRLEERRQHRLKEPGNVMASVGGAHGKEEDGDEEAEEDGKDAGGGNKGVEKQGADHCKSSFGGRRDGGEIVRKKKAGEAVDGKAAPLRQGSRPELSVQNDAGKVSEAKKQLAAAATSAQKGFPSTGPSLSSPVKPTSKPPVKASAKLPSKTVVKPGLKSVLKAKQTQKATSTPAAPSIHENRSMPHSAPQMHEGTPSISHQGANRGVRQGASVQKKAVMAVAGAVGEDTGGKAGKMGEQEAGTNGVVRKPAGGGEQKAGVSGEVGAKSMRAVLKRKRAVAVADESARRIAAPGASVDAAVGGADDDMPAPTPATTPTTVTAAPPRPAAMAVPGAVDAKASQAKKEAANRATQQRQGAPVALAHTKSKAPVVKEVKVDIPVKSAEALKRRNVAAEGTISDRTGTVGAASVAKVVGEVGTSNAPASGQGSTGKGSSKLLARKTAAAKRESITNTTQESDARSGQGVQAAAAKVALSGPGKGGSGTVAMGGTGSGLVKKRKLGEGKDRGSVVKLLEQQMEGVAAQGMGKAPALTAGAATTSKAGVSPTTLADAANLSDPGVATGAASAVGVVGRGQKKGVNSGGVSLKVVQVGAPRNLPKLKLGSSAPKGGTKAAAVTVGPVSVDKAGSGRSNQVSQKGISKKGAKDKTLANTGAAQMDSGVPGVTDELGTCTDVTREATGEKCTQDPAPQGGHSSATIGTPGATKVPARKKQPLVIKIQKPRHAVAVEGSSLSKGHDLE